MLRADEYRERAEEMMELAKRTSDETLRRQYLKLASSWYELAGLGADGNPKPPVGRW